MEVMIMGYMMRNMLPFAQMEAKRKISTMATKTRMVLLAM